MSHSGFLIYALQTLTDRISSHDHENSWQNELQKMSEENFIQLKHHIL